MVEDVPALFKGLRQGLRHFVAWSWRGGVGKIFACLLPLPFILVHVIRRRGGQTKEVFNLSSWLCKKMEQETPAILLLVVLTLIQSFVAVFVGLFMLVAGLMYFYNLVSSLVSLVSSML